MFSFKATIVGQSLTVESGIKAATARNYKGADKAMLAGISQLREYIALQFSVDAFDGDLTARAFNALKDVKDYGEFASCGKTFKELYGIDYAARNPSKDETARTNACNMAWSRFWKRAESVKNAKGAQVWTHPEKAKSETPEAIQARQKRESDKAVKAANNGGKVVDGRANGNNRKSKSAQPAKSGDSTKPAQPSAIVNAPAIVVHAEKDAELRAALDWIAQSGDNKRAFVEWFKSQKVLQLQSVKAA
jgi:hypothetical protein